MWLNWIVLPKMFIEFDLFLKDSLDKNLMWMRDTGVIQKMESDIFRESEIAEHPITNIRANQPLTVTR